MAMSKGQRVIANPFFVLVFVSLVASFFNLIVLGGEANQGLLIYFFGVVSFGLGFLGVKLCLSFKVSVSNPSRPPTPSRTVINVYLILSLISFFLSVLNIYRIGVGGEYGFVFNLRYAASNASESYYGAQHLSLFSLALSFYYFYFGRHFIGSLLTLPPLLAAFAMGERTTIFLVFSSIFYFLFINDKVSLKKALLPFSALLLVFIYMAQATGKTSGVSSYSFIYEYIGKGIDVFDMYVVGRPFEGCASYVFGLAGRVYDNFLSVEGACDLTSDLHVKDRHNVYTYVAAPYLYAGYLGVALIMALIGVVYAVFWNLSLTKSGYFSAIISVIMYGVFMSFYAWQFSMTFYLYFALIFAPMYYKIRVLK